MAQLQAQWPRRRHGSRKPQAPPTYRLVLPPPDLTGPPCHWCGLATDNRKGGAETPHILTRDHIIPRKHGGATGRVVTVPACKHCNGRRGHEQDGRWVPFPKWREPGMVLPRSQRDALRRRGVLTV